MWWLRWKLTAAWLRDVRPGIRLLDCDKQYENRPSRLWCYCGIIFMQFWSNLVVNFKERCGKFILRCIYDMCNSSLCMWYAHFFCMTCVILHCIWICKFAAVCEFLQAWIKAMSSPIVLWKYCEHQFGHSTVFKTVFLIFLYYWLFQICLWKLWQFCYKQVNWLAHISLHIEN